MTVRVNMRKDNTVEYKTISILHQHLHAETFKFQNQNGDTEKFVGGGICGKSNSSDSDDKGCF